MQAVVLKMAHLFKKHQAFVLKLGFIQHIKFSTAHVEITKVRHAGTA